MAGQSFPVWPQPNFPRSTFTYHRRPHPPYTLRQFHPLTLRTMANSPRSMSSESGFSNHGQPASVTSITPSFDGFTGGNNHGLASVFNGGSSFFDDWFHYPEDSVNTSDIIDVPQWREQQQPGQHLPFRAIEVGGNAPAAVNSSFVSDPTLSLPSVTEEVAVRQFDNSPSLHAHPVLSCPVDTSHYQLVHDEDWMWSSVESTDAPSPSSVDSSITRPYTPTSPIGGDAFIRNVYGNASSDTFIPKVESTPFGSSGSSSTFGSFSSDFSQSSLSSAASFGTMTHAGSFGQLSSTPVPPSRVAQPGSFTSHAHGMPMGGSVANQLIPPQQIFPPPPTAALSDLEDEYLETSPETSGDETESETDASDQAVANAQTRRSRDKYLLKMRQRGYSYKEIKRLGNFREAESTLRGRVRVLTKDKSERVRCPKWTDNDIDLLERAMAHFDAMDDRYGRGRDAHSRVPWKKISDWMRSRGSSYRFAPATCAKKWKEQI